MKGKGARFLCFSVLLAAMVLLSSCGAHTDSRQFPAPTGTVSVQQVSPEAVAQQAEPTLDKAGAYTTKEDVALYIHLYNRLPDRWQVYTTGIFRRRCKTKERTQEYLAGKPIFPPYYGKNLDALYDVLTSCGEPVHIRIRYPSSLRTNLGNYGQTLLRVFQEAAEANRNITVEIKESSRKEQGL